MAIRMLGIIFILGVFSLIRCEYLKKKPPSEIKDHTTLSSWFNNRKGRYPRFINTYLSFGDTINHDAKEILGFPNRFPKDNSLSLHRKAAHIFQEGGDTTIFYLYGIAHQDSILNEMRVRSFYNGDFIEDTILIDLKKYGASIRYDYMIDGNVIEVRAEKSRKYTHYSHFILKKGGQIINDTFIPDTIFRRQDWIPDEGRIVRISDNFEKYTIKINNHEMELKGRIVNVFRGMDCRTHMIIDLENNAIHGYKYLFTNGGINISSKLFGLNSDSLIIGLEACLKYAASPITEPELLKETCYIEYY